jgi:hypothetical protein
LIWPPSFNRRPSAFVNPTRSEPAKSTKFYIPLLVLGIKVRHSNVTRQEIRVAIVLFLYD